MLIRKSFTIIVDQVAVPSGSEDLSIVAVDLSAGMFSHVKHGARCAMGKVGEDNKPKKGEEFQCITDSTVVLTCCKGDCQSQWKTPHIWPLTTRKPFNRFR